LPRGFDGARQPNAIVALLHIAARSTNELFEQSRGLFCFTLAAQHGREEVQSCDVCRREFGDTAQRSLRAREVLKMHVVGLCKLGECPNLLIGAAVQTRDANQGFGRALPVLGGAVRVHELLKCSEVMRVEL
jgi:hypothetical protein